MTYSSAGFAATKLFEGLRQTAYQDVAGVWTIGDGHTGADVHPGERISEAEADELLAADLQVSVDCVNSALKVPVTQGQFDALVDFCFNCGRGNLLGSSLLKKVNAGDFAGAAGEFPKWVHAGNQVVPGLVRRRKAEQQLFLGGPVTA